MKKILLIFILNVCSFTIIAQDKTITEIVYLFEKNQYDKIIEQHAPISKDYSGMYLYYIGYSYYMQKDYDNSLKYLDLSIAKDAKNSASYYLKASILTNLGKGDEAITCYQTAINLKPDDAAFYIGLGNLHFQHKEDDLALENYKKATENAECPIVAYLMIADIYLYEKKEYDKALEAYYNLKSMTSNHPKEYSNALYNIGQIELLKENYDKAESTFLELLPLATDNYHAYTKLIQIYYYHKNYEKAQPYKDKLYEAQKNGKLKNELNDMFCIDRFKWNDYSIKVFERYENENKGQIYYKHIFFVFDSFGKNIFTIQTEFSPYLKKADKMKYFMCANNGDVHYNSGKTFNDDTKYDDLKAAAIEMCASLIK